MSHVFIDVTTLEPRMKHPTIFAAFDKAMAGQSVVIHNDHDPKPLYYQLLGERGNCFSWTYLENGPEIWKVEIKKHLGNSETVGEIAAKDLRKAELLKKLGIDFCCGGRKTLEEACQEKGLDVIRIKHALQDAEAKPVAGPQLDFNSFTATFLAEYIVNVHHSYVKNNAPIIEELAEKVAAHHGKHILSLNEVREKFRELHCELATHMKKEEQILFPSIKLLEGGGPRITFETIEDPIFVMERDHDIAGDLVKDIRRLCDDFQVPADACNSLKLLYSKLEAFENDLMLHIHLENNILFPKAIKLEAK